MLRSFGLFSLRMKEGGMFAMFQLTGGNLTKTPGGGDSHMKQTGMLVVSLRGVNCRSWSRLGCSGQSANILSPQGLV